MLTMRLEFKSEDEIEAYRKQQIEMINNRVNEIKEVMMIQFGKLKKFLKVQLKLYIKHLLQ